MNSLYKTVLIFLISISVGACSLFDFENEDKQSDIDFLYGTEESGKLKRELHFSDSEDQTVESDIEYVYENGKLSEKIYTDHNWNTPFVLQKDEFIYENGQLHQMIHYFRRGSPTSPLIVSEIYNYSYPDANTKIEVIYEENGELDDSIVYVFEGALLIEERHLSDTVEWGKRFEYNQDGKLQKTIDLETGNVTENYFDENGVLEKSITFTGEEVRSVATYERRRSGDELVIRCYIKHFNASQVEPFLSSHKKYVNRKLVEYVKSHPTFPGSEWFCTNYEYY